jgi:hypothetical protein
MLGKLEVVGTVALAEFRSLILGKALPAVAAGFAIPAFNSPIDGSALSAMSIDYLYFS